MKPTFPSTEKLDEAFERWWFDEGSEMPPLPGEDHGFHARRIARIAWHNGAFAKQQRLLEDNS